MNCRKLLRMERNVSPQWLCLVCMVFIFFKVIPLHAQTLTTQGTEFFITFMKNGYRGCNGAASNEKLTVTASAVRGCQVTVWNPNTGWRLTQPVADNGMTTFVIPEQQGYNVDSETVGDKGLIVYSSDTISLFLANEATNSFDAALVLPLHALSDHYITQNYTPSSYALLCFDVNTSSFVIVATEDSTVIDITPACITAGGRQANTPFSVELEKGQCYQVLSRDGGAAGDLTGSVVTARDCKKIAVFNGNVLTGVPLNQPSGFDHIFEQAVPVSYWGKKFAVTTSRHRSGDYVRVTASKNNTVLTKDGIFLATLNSGNSFEFFLHDTIGSCFLETSTPSAVTLYQTTYHVDRAERGDPSMVWVTPVEQQIREIVFGTFTAQNIIEHYVNIVTPTHAVASVRLDGLPIDTPFRPLRGNPDFSYAGISLAPGIHRLESSTGLTAHVYGFGNTQGYAYSVGSKALDLAEDLYVNHEASKLIPPGRKYCLEDPVLFSVITCYDYRSIFWDLGDGTTATGDSILHSFAQEGAYEITAYVERTFPDCRGAHTDTLKTRITFSPPRYYFQDTVCMGTLYERNGFSIVAERDTVFTDSLLSVSGCDSIRILDLKVDPVFIRYDTVMLDEEELPFRFGEQELYSSGNYEIRFSSLRGCDSICRLTLVISTSYLFHDEVSICHGDSYEFRGRLLDTAGVYYDSLSTVSGYDSVYMLTLTVHPFYLFKENISVCDHELFVFNGRVLTDSGVYSDSLVTEYGCDSVFIVNLTVNASYLFEEEREICTWDSVSFHGIMVKEPGVYYDSLETEYGCDSIYRLRVISGTGYHNTIKDYVCKGEEYRKNGFSVAPHDQPGEFRYVYDFITEEGCDSTVTLILTVPEVEVEIEGTQNDFCENHYLFLSARTTCTAIKWNNGETFSSVEVHSPGHYSVTVSDYGCTAYDDIYIEECESAVFLPNAITPGNRDGQNDEFCLMNKEQIEEVKIYIYNRWGELVFYSQDIHFRWDGSYKGQTIVPSIYNYVLFVKPVMSGLTRYTGSITVL